MLLGELSFFSFDTKVKVPPALKKAAEEFPAFRKDVARLVQMIETEKRRTEQYGKYVLIGAGVLAVLGLGAYWMSRR